MQHSKHPLKELDMGMVQDTHPEYDFYQLFFQNGDTGHAGAARDRTYVIGSHQEKSSCQQDPFMLHAEIRRKMRKKVKTQPQDYCFADPWEISLEAMAVLNRSGAEWRQEYTLANADLRGLLSAREADALHRYEEAFMERFPHPPATDRNLVAYLADDPAYSLTWSALSRRVPTMRLNARTGKLFYPALNRWLVARERLATLGWPVTAEMAEAMSTPPIQAKDYLRAADLAGNAMALPSVAVAQLLALSCFAPLRA